MEFKGLTSALHMSLPEAGYGSEEGYVGSEISGAVSGVTTPGASRLQASQLQQRSTTMQRLHWYPTYQTDLSIRAEIQNLPVLPNNPKPGRVSELLADLDHWAGRLMPGSYSSDDLLF